MAVDFALVPLESIVVNREKRQRRKIDRPDDLIDSIKRLGVITPILLTREMVLVAGERRLMASKALGLPTIPAYFRDQLSSFDLDLIELEENIKREELPWQDQVLAVTNYHNLRLLAVPTWTQIQTAESIGLSPGWVSDCLLASQELKQPQIAQAQTVRAAVNIIRRQNERTTGNIISDILAASKRIVGMGAPTVENPVKPDGTVIVSNAAVRAQQAAPVEPPSPILNENFLTWAPKYEGDPFNMIHCDFPYGIKVFSGGQANTTGAQQEYDDNPELYWALIECLAEHLDKLMSASAHMIFWFPMEYYTETLEAFRKMMPSLAVQKYPLIWVKSDNMGILPDPRRGPRRIYETAFIASRMDRVIVKAVSNAYSAPTDKSLHPSAKPAPVLRHFFQMFCDNNTTIFDPTCGSGFALQAAEALGARKVLGLEIDPDTHKLASDAFKKFRLLRGLAK